MEWASGPRDGDWFTIANGLAKLAQDKDLGLPLRVVTGVGVVNPTRVQMGVSKLALGWNFLTRAAVKGEAPYQFPYEKLRSFGSGYTSVRHYFIAAAGQGPDDLKSILSYRQARIGLPARDSVESMTLRRILEFYGTRIDALRASGVRFVTGSHADLIAAWNDGKVDYLYLTPFQNTSVLAEIAQGNRRARLVPFPPDLIAHLTQNVGFSSQRVAKAMHPLLMTSDILVPTTESTILVADTFPEDAARKLMRCLIENAGPRLGQVHPALLTFNPEMVAVNPSAPLHSGVELALRDAGLLRSGQV